MMEEEENPRDVNLIKEEVEENQRLEANLRKDLKDSTQVGMFEIEIKDVRNRLCKK